MQKQLLLRVAAAVAIVALSVRSLAADDLKITTQRDEPVHEILMKIQESYHWRIAYEEGPVLFAGDLIPRVTKTGMPRLIHRVHPISITLPQLVSNSTETKRTVIQAVFDAFNRSGNPEQFRSFDEFGYINVVQTKIVGPDGQLENFEPLLDTEVTLPKKNYGLWELVDSIVNQVAAARHVTIQIMSIPTSLFFSASLTEGSTREPARKVLMRAFEALNGPRLSSHAAPLRLTWDMMYSPTEAAYFFNVDNIEPEVNLPSAAKQ